MCEVAACDSPSHVEQYSQNRQDLSDTHSGHNGRESFDKLISQIGSTPSKIEPTDFRFVGVVFYGFFFRSDKEYGSKAVAGKKPETFITDGLYVYQEAYTKEYWARDTKDRTLHIRNITFKGEHTNSKMERLNGEIRDREKVMRSLKKDDTPILTGYQLFHNYIRPHMALDNRTPAELCGIQVEGENKWLTIIQNASNAEKERP